MPQMNYSRIRTLAKYIEDIFVCVCACVCVCVYAMAHCIHTHTQAGVYFGSNIYFSAVVKSWRDDFEEAGVDVLFKHGRKLVGDRTAKSRLSVTRVHESQFADDAALYTTSRADSCEVCTGG